MVASVALVQLFCRTALCFCAGALCANAVASLKWMRGLLFSGRAVVYLNTPYFSLENIKTSREMSKPRTVQHSPLLYCASACTWSDSDGLRLSMGSFDNPPGFRSSRPLVLFSSHIPCWEERLSLCNNDWVLAWAPWDAVHVGTSSYALQLKAYFIENGKATVRHKRRLELNNMLDSTFLTPMLVQLAGYRGHSFESHSIVQSCFHKS